MVSSGGQTAKSDKVSSGEYNNLYMNSHLLKPLRAQEDRPDYAEFMEKYKTQFRETGIKRLLRRDIQQFSKLMATPEDLKVQTEVFLAAVKDSRWRSIQTRSLVGK